MTEQQNESAVQKQTKTKRIRVLIAEDMESIRKRYERILNATEDMEVVSGVGTGAEAVEQAKRLRPDVILMDIEMESSDAGLCAAREILKERPETKIIILTVYEEDELIFTAFQIGACDYIVKTAGPEEFLTSIRNAYAGQSPLRPELASKILGEFKRVRDNETSFIYAINVVSSLTASEMETLDLLIQGKTRREICRERHVEMSTVKTQIHEILRKFDRSSVKEVIEIIDRLDLYDMLFPKGKARTGKKIE